MDDIEGRLLRLLTADKWIEDPETGCWVWNRFTHKGYGIIGTRIEGKGYSRPASRVALRGKLGRPIRPGMLACHTCDTPSCVNPDHLYEGTPKENTRDMIERGRRGNSHILGGLATRKLTDEQAQTIRERATSGEYQSRLAEEYGVSRSTIFDIVRGKNYGGHWVDCRGEKAELLSRRAPRGMTNEVVKEALRRIVLLGESQRSVAKDIGVSASVFSHIRHGRLYRDAVSEFEQEYGVSALVTER